MLPDTKANVLRDRAVLLKQARDFFYQRDVVEVDCPILSTRASIDAHIDLIPALYHHKERCYLHSSPEFGMKRLLAEGIGDCYQLSHVFRDGEWGVKHNPEFMMAEWYRLGFSLEQLMEETIQFCRLFLGDLPATTITYREAFKHCLGIDYVNMSEHALLKFIQDKGIPFYPEVVSEGKDAILNLILGSCIEPQLGKDGLCVLAYYPSTQAALAQKKRFGDEEVAERFEVYYQGAELANGYHELANPSEQHERFIEANAARVASGKNALPIDTNFLKALEKGLPDCCGVAVGVDRLMMLRHKRSNIADVLAWGWAEA